MVRTKDEENGRDTLLAWLNDAYAMEQGLAETLKRQAEHAKDRAEVRRKLEEHAELTRSQAKRVKVCIESLGGDTSTIKTTMGKLEGIFSGMSTRPAGDTLIKDALAGYAAEHLEIASYKALIVAADALNEQRVSQTCEEILQEEEEMARWLEQSLPLLVRDYVQHTSQPSAV
jgi:ferritin-like metal-binding protein YciE